MKSTLSYLLVLQSILFVTAHAYEPICKDGDFMKDPDSCDHFFKCDHGKPVKFACGSGTWFNPNINACDWPYKVKCDVNPGGKKPDGNSSGQQANVNQGGQRPGGGSHVQPDNGSGYTGDQQYSEGASNYGKPSNDHQGQNNRPGQGQNLSPQNPDNEEYLWPIQTPDSDSGSQNSNDGSTGPNGEERPRPTIDDTYNGNNNPYEEYLGNNRV